MKTTLPAEHAARLRSLARVLDTTPADALALVLETGFDRLDSPDGPLVAWAMERGPVALIRVTRRLKRAVVLKYRAGLAASWMQMDGETLRTQLAADLRQAFAAINTRIAA
jgi:hypothetical protein